jgi:hypothetical protein
MNELNNASLEASKRLVDAGIVLETDASRIEDPLGGWNKRVLPTQMCKTKYQFNKRLPAPSMAEVWRELPEQTMLYRGDTLTEAYNTQKKISFANRNPTDALIDLLIFIKGVDSHK